jgi:hypothetical protein
MGTRLYNFINIQHYKLILNNCFGGDKRDRTADLLHAMQALSQLSYTPNKQIEKYFNCFLHNSQLGLSLLKDASKCSCFEHPGSRYAERQL